MTPLDAVRSTLRQYAVFSGRASRPELGWSVAAYLGSAALTATVDTLLFGQLLGMVGVMPLTWALVAVSVVPLFAVLVRRLHDTGRSGWWYLIQLVPLVGPVWLLVLLCSPSVPVGAGAAPVRRTGQPAAAVDDGVASLLRSRA